MGEHAELTQPGLVIGIEGALNAADASRAASVYCAGLREKIQPLLGPVERAAGVLACGLNADRMVLARLGGEIVGVAGFRHGGRGAFSHGLRELVREYGVSGVLRGAGLLMLGRAEGAGWLVMDGLAVDERARGRGIGTALLHAIAAEAKRLGKAEVRLSVIDTNGRARALYERVGFAARRESSIGPLRWVFAFRRVTEMAWEIQDR